MSLARSARRLLQLAVMLSWMASSAHAATFTDRRISDVLSELRSAGFVFIYSTSTVPADLRVRSEPAATSGLELAREILAAHGLALIEAAPKVYSVVRGAMPSTASAQVAPAAAIEQVVVETSRYLLSGDYGAPSIFLSQDQLKDVPELADETLRAIQRLPGSATNGFSSVGPIRGGAPDEIAIVLDGLRLYEPFHLKNFQSPVSLLDSRLIEGMEFFSGGFPALYGERMSAIVDARSIRPGQARYFEAGLNLFHFSALGSVSFADGRGHALASYRRSNVGDLIQFSEKDYGEPNYQDAFARVDFSLTDDTDASLEFLVSGDRIVAKRSDDRQVERAEYQNVYVWGTLDHEWSDAYRSRLIASYTNLENERRGKIDEPGRRAGLSDDRLFHVVGLRWENTLDTAWLTHRFGLEARRLWGSYDYASEVDWAEGSPFPGSPSTREERQLSSEPDGYEVSGYWDGRAELGERWTVQGGLRGDAQTYGDLDADQWSPRLSVLFAASRATSLRASWGRFNQAQSINELQVEDGIDEFHPAQSADHFILGIDHAFETGIDLRMEAYWKHYRRLSPRFENMFDPLVLFPELAYDRVMIDPETARARGIETTLRLRPRGSWSGWLSYTWSQVEDRIDGDDVPRSWDQRHAITLGVSWSKGPWIATLANSYHSGWPTTALAFDPAYQTPVISAAGRNRLRFAAYNSLDLRVSRVFALGRGVLEVFGEVTNATSRENPCCVEYRATTDADGTVSYPVQTDTWLPLVPNVGVLWRY